MKLVLLITILVLILALGFTMRSGYLATSVIGGACANTDPLKFCKSLGWTYPTKATWKNGTFGNWGTYTGKASKSYPEVCGYNPDNTCFMNGYLAGKYTAPPK
jgi:hypothetical protein